MHGQAEWAEEVSDYASAATMYIQAKKYDKAVALLGKIDGRDMMVDVMRALGEGQTKPYRRARDTSRVGVTPRTLKRHIISLGTTTVSSRCTSRPNSGTTVYVGRHQEYSDKVYLPTQDGSQIMTGRRGTGGVPEGGKSELSTHMLEQLTHNAVLSVGFKRGYCYWLMSQEIAGVCRKIRASRSMRRTRRNSSVSTSSDRAEIYYVRRRVHRNG